MTSCSGCDLPIGESPSCEISELAIGGRLYERSRFTQRGEEERPEFQRDCPGCGVEQGNLHHVGCELEICPGCEGQLVECDCEYLLPPPL